MTERNHSEIAYDYAVAVVNGDILSGELVVLACQRFLDDLERSENGGEDFPYEFNPHLANRACRFMELLPHVKGKWASKREYIVLQPWQCFIECNIFGWVQKETGLRRFRTAYEEEARKNGKSTRLAARGIYLFSADGETGAEVYSGATTEKQAHEIFRPAWQMVQRTPQLKERFNVEQSGNAKNPGPMYKIEDLSRFETVIGKPGDGASPHGALVDEYHEHDNDHMVDTMQTGMGAREQPLLSIITTAGSNLAGPCYEMRREIVAILKGTIKDERLFGMIYTLDEDDAWDDPANLVKANPNFGISVHEDFLLHQLEQARRSASKQNSFRTKHLNQWVGAKTVWMNMLAWQKQSRDIKIEDMGNAPCWLAVDLASKKDVAALIALFHYEDKFCAFPYFYVPESAVEENDKYQQFITSEEMIATPGNMTDYAFIEEQIVQLNTLYNVQDVSFDDWQANYLMTRLTERSVRVVNFNQTVRNMSEPMKEVEARVLNNTLIHNGNSVLTWMMGNVAARVDAKENIYPRKENPADSRCKIDGPVALIMAAGRALINDAQPEKQYQVVIV